MTRAGRRVLLSLGSNLGDRHNHLRRAVAAMDDVVAVSPVFETEPMGGPEQGAYLNIVVELWSVRTPMAILEECRRLESDADRLRAERWGPRTLDLDVIWIDGYTSDDPELTVPHPRARERNFVMVPLAHLDSSNELLEGMVARGAVNNVGPL